MRIGRPTTAGLVALLAALLATGAEGQAGDVTIYVVRHAERAEDGTNDPPISDVGRARAELVREMMAGARLTYLHTTDLRRTRSTLEPTAAATGLVPTVYDPRDLAAFAARLRSMPGRHLVVGHSNTNTALVEALGGEAGPPITEMEYDRAYVLVVLPGGATGTSVFRFGAGDSRP